MSWGEPFGGSKTLPWIQKPIRWGRLARWRRVPEDRWEEMARGIRKQPEWKKNSKAAMVECTYTWFCICIAWFYRNIQYELCVIMIISFIYIYIYTISYYMIDSEIWWMADHQQTAKKGGDVFFLHSHRPIWNHQPVVWGIFGSSTLDSRRFS